MLHSSVVNYKYKQQQQQQKKCLSLVLEPNGERDY